ncbi:HAD family hydrolase [Actinomadura sp. DC4]|uniref:HAD family hydrolase n=1 Tax=Actinomadura sp. DC4 TaxID=3055069 RepID=UPI0025B176CB|nr:HAD family hydrolase [Actinomadura sp. DC4]MDN3358270.1 hydrolase [Actinomadura sp. DC4]
MRTGTGECVLGGDITAVIFGVDGVVIDSARTSAGAWKTVMDPFLRAYAAAHETAFTPFGVREDYLRYTHGRPRIAGARDFLASRGVSLPYDDLRALTIRQEEFFLAEVRRHGVSPFGSAVTLIREARRRGIRTAAVSTQRHGGEVLRSAGVVAMFDIVLDGLDAPGTGLPSGPDSALFAQAALRMGAQPRHTAVVEEIGSAVAAAQRGGFGLVVGVDRLGVAGTGECGADLIVTDLSELRVHAA